MILRLPLRRRYAVAGVFLLALVGVANVPTTSNVLVDYRPRMTTQPLYAKAIAFVNRDIQMRQLAQRVVGDARSDVEKAERLLRWTTANVRSTPPGLPAVDDHPYHTVVRGYGDVDQAADVFANLAAYAGIPGDLVLSRGRDGSMLYAFAVLQVDGVDRLFDVREGIAFRNRAGDLAPLEELRKDASLLSGSPLPREAQGLTYVDLVGALEDGAHRRSDDQILLTRVMNEVRRLLRIH